MQEYYSKSSSLHDPTSESNDDIARFDKSLQELRALRSQLHHAADYSENTFLASKQKKKKVVESTKKYICRAMVTVVDHLGSAAANLDALIDEPPPIQFRIDTLKQRLLTCQTYTNKFNLAQFCWNTEFNPKHHHAHYYTQSKNANAQHERSGGILLNRYPDQKFDNIVNEKVRRAVQTDDDHPNIRNLDAPLISTSGFDQLSKALVLPISEGPSILWRPRNSSFPSSGHEHHQLARNEKNKKTSLLSNKIKRMI